MLNLYIADNLLRWGWHRNCDLSTNHHRTCGGWKSRLL